MRHYKGEEHKMKEFDPSEIDFDNPSALFRLEDNLKGLIGGPLYYEPYFRSCGGFQGDERVLDFGCGGGIGTRCIADHLRRGGLVTGVDVSSYFASKAKKRLATRSNAEILRGEIGELNLAKVSFDLITIIHVIHDIAKAKRPATVRSLGAVLKPGGTLWIWEPTRASHGMPVEEIRALMGEIALSEVSAQIGANDFRGVFEKPA